MDILVLLAAASGTALATGLGAIHVSHLGERAESLRPVLWGLTVGLMTVASVVGLLVPGLREGSAGSWGAGLTCGILFLLLSRRFIAHRHVAFWLAARGGGSGGRGCADACFGRCSRALGEPRHQLRRAPGGNAGRYRGAPPWSGDDVDLPVEQGSPLTHPHQSEAVGAFA